MLYRRSFGIAARPGSGAPPQERGSHLITFITPSGLPPYDLHACCTPWSVFQDGSIRTILSAAFPAFWESGVPRCDEPVLPRGKAWSGTTLHPPTRKDRGSPQSHAAQHRRGYNASPREDEPPSSTASLPRKTAADLYTPESGPRKARSGHAQQLFQAFPFQQFHVLLNSLFRVLFIFPSRYLFAIGLLRIFSLGWNLPPILDCIPKQSDSLKDGHIRDGNGAEYGVFTLSDCSTEVRHVPMDFCQVPPLDTFFYTLQLAGSHRRFQMWALPVSFAITRGILVSFFSSAY